MLRVLEVPFKPPFVFCDYCKPKKFGSYNRSKRQTALPFIQASLSLCACVRVCSSPVIQQQRRQQWCEMSGVKKLRTVSRSGDERQTKRERERERAEIQTVIRLVKSGAKCVFVSRPASQIQNSTQV